jgi:hypothetical protein
MISQEQNATTTQSSTQPPVIQITTTYHSTTNHDSIMVAIMSGLLVFFSFWLMIIVHKLVKQRIRDRHSHQSGENKVHTEPEERILHRYETIEHWLITKRVQKHDDLCTRVVCGIIPQSPLAKDVEAGTTSDGSNLPKRQVSQDDSSFDDSKDDDKECPICMNSLHEGPGHIVSWSANVKCSHVYHHECIKEWLLRRTRCPCCRETFLPCDEVRGDKKSEALKEMSQRYTTRASTTFYCLHDGLISLPPISILKNRIFDSTLKPEELILLRGERQDDTAIVVNDDVECGLPIEDSSDNPFIEEEDFLEEYSPNDTNVRVTLSFDKTQPHFSTIQHGTDNNDNSVGDVPEDAEEEEEQSGNGDSNNKAADCCPKNA